MLNKLIKSMALFLCRNQIIHEDEIEIYEYGLELLLTSIFEILAVLIISICIGKLLITALFLLSFCCLRTFAGGFHASTNFKCFLTLLVVYAAFLSIDFLTNQSVYKSISINFSIISEVIVLLLAPVGSENKPLSVEEIKRYRFISIAIVSFETLVVFSLWFIPALLTKDVMLGVSFGQLTAAVSLIAVKIINVVRSNKNETIKSGND